MTWVSRNSYLSKSEQDNNAYIIYKALIKEGYSLNAVSAVLGNMVVESNINPGIWESLTYNPQNGYGLVQWTPSTKLKDWCDEKGLDWKSGDAQVQKIIHEIQTNTQWGDNPYAHRHGYTKEPPFDFNTFMHSRLSPQELAVYFSLYYEKPAERYFVSSMTDRQSYAGYYFSKYYGVDPNPEPDLPIDPPKPMPPFPVKPSTRKNFWVLNCNILPFLNRRY